MFRNLKFCLGALMGTVFGLTFAPKSGKELRKELHTEIKKGGHGEKTMTNAALDIGKDITETSKELYNDPEIQKQLKQKKDQALRLATKAKNMIEESGEEWVQIAREKLTKGSKNFEKQASKAIDSIKKAVDTVHAKRAEISKKSAKK